MFEAAISSLTDVQDFIEKLPMLGYQYLPNRSYPVPEYAYRHFFIKGPESNRTHHLKLIELHDKEWKNSIFFRDCLRANADVRNKYIELKQRLAEKYADDRVNYTGNKTEFIHEIIRKARQKGKEVAHLAT